MAKRTTRRDKIVAGLPRPHTERYLADEIGRVIASGGVLGTSEAVRVLREIHAFLDHAADQKTKSGRPKKWDSPEAKNKFYNDKRKEKRAAAAAAALANG